ncbi:MAG: hypothetical protein RL885_30365 [Planctomycetota bacterium]
MKVSSIWIVMLILVGCQAPERQERFELASVSIGGAESDWISSVEVELNQAVAGELTDVSLNFATSETFELTVAYRRGTVQLPARRVYFEDIELSPATNTLWVQLKVETSTGLQDEQRFQVF